MRVPKGVTTVVPKGVTTVLPFVYTVLSIFSQFDTGGTQKPLLTEP